MPPGDLTLLLERLCAGETGVERQVFDRVYDELRRIAAHQMRGERKDHTLQPTALVHEAYLRLLGGASIQRGSRAQFFHAAARAMRQVLIDHARGKGRAKRGSDRLRLDIDVEQLVWSEDPTELLAVDEALCRLEEEDPRAAEVARLRLYAGLDNAETAEALGISKRTVEREWSYIRTWLYDALR